MKKFQKISITLAVMSLIDFSGAYAENPFVDVPSDSWAYRSVADLANSGIIQGVNGKEFEGNRSITRYEAAEITAKALAQVTRANTSQRQVIYKLAREFATELQTLGVRVDQLESRVGTVTVSGDARLRWRHQNVLLGRDEALRWNYPDKKFEIDPTHYLYVDNAGYSGDRAWDYQMNLRADAPVNERVSLHVGVTTDNQQFSSNETAQNTKTFINRAYINYRPLKQVLLQVGRFDDYTLGKGYQYGDVLDGAIIRHETGQGGLTAGYGKLKSGDTTRAKVYAFDEKGNQKMVGWHGSYYKRYVYTIAPLQVKTAFLSGDTALNENTRIGLYYSRFMVPAKYRSLPDGTEAHKTYQSAFRATSLWGTYLDFLFPHEGRLLLNYEQVQQNDAAKVMADERGMKAKPAMWLGRFTLGNVQEKVGSWDMWVEYLHADKGAQVGGSSASWRKDVDNIKSVGLGMDYRLAKNVTLSVAQTISSSWINRTPERVAPWKKDLGPYDNKGETIYREKTSEPQEYTSVSLKVVF